MFLSRTLALAFFSLAAASTAQAAPTSSFSVLLHNSGGQPILFQSTGALKKGDVISVQSLNAHPVLVLEIAMCDHDCSNVRLIREIPLTGWSTRFVVPENGRVSFWVQQVGDPLGVTITKRSQGFAFLSAPVNPFLLGFGPPRLYPDTWPMPAESVNINDDSLIASYSHHIFVNVSLADVNG
jgi:hypothetical protein